MMAMSMTPMARYGKPEEIAETALFLSTAASSYFSGQILFPAGGMFTG
jgi:gluconate 5-dehydrogenase